LYVQIYQSIAGQIESRCSGIAAIRDLRLREVSEGLETLWTAGLETSATKSVRYKTGEEIGATVWPRVRSAG